MAGSASLAVLMNGTQAAELRRSSRGQMSLIKSASAPSRRLGVFREPTKRTTGP